MASAGFGEDAGAKRPNVQIGDPFMEKLLLEACLEAMQKGLVVGIQDMGAAGLTCSSCEMGARGGTGVELELDKVPQREAAMTAYEIMLSESQERMLLVAEKDKEKELFEVFHKWGLDAVTVGYVTDDGLLRVKQHGKVKRGNSQHRAGRRRSGLSSGRFSRRPAPRSLPIDLYAFLDGTDDETIAEVPRRQDSRADELLKLAVSLPNLCSRQWVWEQYDHMVQSNTMVGPGSDAAVIRVKGTKKALAMTLDGPGFRVAQNPREGAKLMVAEACRNIVCSGGRPMAATNCLNFGNPEHPEVMWQFSEVVDGMTEACIAFGTPITGGNVSFYNETFERDIYPTPVLGVVGMIDNLAHVTSSDLQGRGRLHRPDRNPDASDRPRGPERGARPAELRFRRDSRRSCEVGSRHFRRRNRCRPGRNVLFHASPPGDRRGRKNSSVHGCLQGPVRGVLLAYPPDYNTCFRSGTPR